MEIPSSALVRHHLTLLANKDMLVAELAKVVAALASLTKNSAKPVKRGRGRPRKQK